MIERGGELGGVKRGEEREREERGGEGSPRVEEVGRWNGVGRYWVVALVGVCEFQRLLHQVCNGYYLKDVTECVMANEHVDIKDKCVMEYMCIYLREFVANVQEHMQ